MRAALRGKFIALSAYIKISSRALNLITSWWYTWKFQKKKEESTHRKSRPKEIIKLKSEINEIETNPNKTKNQLNKEFVL